MALKPLHEVKKDPGTTVAAVAWFLSPVLWVVAFLMGLPAWVQVVVGVPAVVLLMILGWAMLSFFKELVLDPWRGLTPPAGWTYHHHDPGLREWLWPGQPDPTGRRRGRLGHVLLGTVGGRRAVLVGQFSFPMWLGFALVELDGRLPTLEVAHQVTLGVPDPTTLEDAEFNDRFKVVAPDLGPDAARYAHRIMHPRMMNLLLSRDPLPFEIRGSFLATTINGHDPADEVQDGLAKAAFLAEVADLIPPGAYAEFGRTL